MRTSFGTLLAGLTIPRNGSFHAVPISGQEDYFAGRDHSGLATLLVRAGGVASTVPLRLAGLSASFAVPCRIVEPGGTERTESLTCMTCLSSERATEDYFASIVDLLVGMLGPAPAAASLEDALRGLIELFQKLKNPARRPITGLVGELLVINAAHNATAAAAAWRTDPDERYDFSCGNLRVEAKASGTRHRAHSISLEQAEPPSGTTGLLASLLVEQASGGTSLADLVGMIEGRLATYSDVLRVRSIIADTLGQDLPRALGWRFDLALASSSLALFDLRSIPAVRGVLPAGVSGVRFTTDLSASRPVTVAELAVLALDARAMLPG